MQDFISALRGRWMHRHTIAARRRLGVALALVTLAAACTAPAASANSVGCTWAEGSGASYVCLGIYGSGTYVNQFRVSRNHQYNSICNYRARVVVYQPTRGSVTYYSSYHSGCSWNTAWMDVWPRRNFENKSKACGYWYESGRWLSGVPCNQIHS